MARVDCSESRFRASWVERALSRPMFHSGFHFSQRLVGEPRRKPFVEPHVVPPRHGDEIAKPHVRDLVGEHAGDGLFRAERRGGGIGEQELLSKRDRGGVLHGACGEIRHANHVQFAEGILDAEVAVVEGELLFGRLERKAGQRQLVRSRAHANGRAVARSAPAHEVPDEHSHEIRGHSGRGRKLHGVLPIARTWRVRQHMSVRDGGVAGVDHEGDIERRLQCWLVEGGEGAACVGGLELCHRIAPVVGRAQVEPAELVIELPAVGEAKRRRSGGKLIGKLQGDGLRWLVRCDDGTSGDAAGGNGHLVQIELGGVQNDPRGGLHQMDRDLALALESSAREVGCEFQGVGAGDDRRGQPLSFDGWDGNQKDGQRQENSGHITVEASCDGPRPPSEQGRVTEGRGQTPFLCCGCLPLTRALHDRHAEVRLPAVTNDSEAHSAAHRRIGHEAQHV